MQSISNNLMALARLNPDICLVGGGVRNSILGLPCSDIDITGAALAFELVLPTGFKCVMVNEKLGTCVISAGEERYEYTPFRIENYEKGGSHSPSSVVFTKDIYKDSLRRDFTMGAVYYRILSGEIIDFHGGINDINNRVLRAVHSATQVFSSDGLRIMRMVRQSCELGFSVDENTFSTAKSMVSQLKDISVERIREELDRILVADTRYGVVDAEVTGLQMLADLGAWQYIIPEIGDCVGSEQNPQYHMFDVYGHTLECVRGVPPHLRLAALMHDVGKPVSMARIGKAYMHPQVGAEITKRVLGQSGLKYPKDVVRRTARLVDVHMHNKDGKTSRSKLRAFVAENHDILDDLVTLMNADTYAKGTLNTNNYAHLYSEVLEEMKRDNIPLSIDGLALNGNDLIALGISGKHIGETLKTLFDRVLSCKLVNEKEALINYVRSTKNQRG